MWYDNCLHNFLHRSRKTITDNTSPFYHGNSYQLTTSFARINSFQNPPIAKDGYLARDKVGYSNALC